MSKPVFLFDICNVMIHVGVKELEARLSAAAGISGAHIYGNHVRDDLVAVETGKMRGTDYFLKIKQSLNLDWIYEDWIVLWMELFSINPVGRNLFLDLKRKGYRVCTLSNLADYNKLAIDRKFPGFLSESFRNFLSFEMGLHKPDARIYAAVCQALKVAPSDCLFLDDSLENVQGAQVAGLRSVQFSNNALDHVIAEIKAFAQSGVRNLPIP